MISIGANGERITYGIKHYNLDTEADLANLPKGKKAMGCTCFVISTSKYYMLNSEQKWVEIKPFGSGSGSGDIIYEGGTVPGGSGGSGNTGGGSGTTTPPTTDKDVIYEGGLI